MFYLVFSQFRLVVLVFGWLCCVAEVEEPSCGNCAGCGGKGATREASFPSASPKPTGYHWFFPATNARAGGGDTIQHVGCYCQATPLDGPAPAPRGQPSAACDFGVGRVRC